jgi:hypothetical protein
MVISLKQQKKRPLTGPQWSGMGIHAREFGTKEGDLSMVDMTETYAQRRAEAERLGTEIAQFLETLPEDHPIPEEIKAKQAEMVRLLRRGPN